MIQTKYRSNEASSWHFSLCLKRTYHSPLSPWKLNCIRDSCWLTSGLSLKPQKDYGASHAWQHYTSSTHSNFEGPYWTVSCMFHVCHVLSWHLPIPGYRQMQMLTHRDTHIAVSDSVSIHGSHCSHSSSWALPFSSTLHHRNCLNWSLCSQRGVAMETGYNRWAWDVTIGNARTHSDTFCSFIILKEIQ